MNPSSSQNILILDGDSRASLALTRSLGRAAYRVSVAESSKRAMAFYSRYCSERLVYPSPETQKDAFLNWIKDRLKEGNYRWILPVSDLTLLPIMGSQEALSDRERLLLPSQSGFETTFDKARTLELAKELEIPTPEYCVSSSPSEALAFAEVQGYPVVVKPPCSRFWFDGLMMHGFRAFAHDQEELSAEVERLARIGVKPLIQEFVRGQGVGIDLVAAEGKIIAAIRHRRLREDPPSGGASTLRVSEPISEQLLDYAQRIVTYLNWSGPMMVEFKEDADNGALSLMEVNGRFWGSLQLAVDSAMDLPAWWMKRVEGARETPPAKYRPGTRTRWTVGELRYLAAVWSQVDDTARSKNFMTEALSVLGNICNPFIHDDTFKWTDPLPGLYEMAHFLGRSIKRGRIL